MVLEVNSRSLEPLKKSEIDTAAEAIVARIVPTVGNWSSDFVVSAREPIPWVFRAANKHEREEAGQKAGVGVILVESYDFGFQDDGRQRREAALAGLSKELVCQMDRAVRKFKDHPQAIRAILLQFFSATDFVTNEDLAVMVRSCVQSYDVDTVWCAVHEWKNESEFDVAWKKVI